MQQMTTSAPADPPSSGDHPPAGVPGQTGRRVLVNTGALTSASLWRIAMSFVLQLLIARQLGVSGLGHYTIALAYLNVCQVISELGLPTLMVRDLAQAPRQRRGYFGVLLSIQTTTSFLTWGGLALIALLLPFSPTTQRALLLVGASLPFFAVTSVSETLFQAGERMELVMGVEMFINTLILVASIAVLWVGRGETALIAVIVVTQGVSALLCLALVAYSRLLSAPQENVKVDIRKMLHRTSPFFALSMGDVLLQRLDILLLSVVGGPAVTGIYGAAYNIVRVLMKLVQSFWRALYPTLSRLHRQSMAHYHRLATVSLRYAFVLVLPATTISMAVAANALQLIYGDNYDASARVYQILIWAAPFFLLENYAITLLMVEHQLRPSLWIMGLHLLAMVILLPGLTAVAGAAGAAWAVVAGGAAGALYGLWVLRQLHLPIHVRRFWGIAVAALGAGLVSAFLPIPWILRAMAGGGIYVLLCWLTGVLSSTDFRALQRILWSTKGT